MGDHITCNDISPVAQCITRALFASFINIFLPLPLSTSHLLNNTILAPKHHQAPAIQIHNSRLSSRKN